MNLITETMSVPTIAPNAQPKRYITLDQVSAKLGGRSKASLYRDIAAGRLPKPIRFGRRCYFRETDIDVAMDTAEATDRFSLT